MPENVIPIPPSDSDADRARFHEAFAIDRRAAAITWKLWLATNPSPAEIDAELDATIAVFRNLIVTGATHAR